MTSATDIEFLELKGILAIVNVNCPFLEIQKKERPSGWMTCLSKKQNQEQVQVLLTPGPVLIQAA